MVVLRQVLAALSVLFVFPLQPAQITFQVVNDPRYLLVFLFSVVFPLAAFSLELDHLSFFPPFDVFKSLFPALFNLK